MVAKTSTHQRSVIIIANILVLCQEPKFPPPEGTKERARKLGGSDRHCWNLNNRLQFSFVVKAARSSSGPGRSPLKAEITGSNPVRATLPTGSGRFVNGPVGRMIAFTLREGKGYGQGGSQQRHESH